MLELMETTLLLSALLTTATLFIWVERRVLGLFQDRYGPNRAGPLGVLQSVADMLKILTKEDWIPPFADRPIFVVAPAIVVVTALLSFAVIPLTPAIGVVDLNIGLLFFLAMSALAVYSVILGGWASHGKYPLLGGLRATAQMISYEVFMGIALMGVVMMAGSFDLRTIVFAQGEGWFALPQLLGLIIFFIAGIAESHRLPFDLPEGENELVAGYQTEYSGMKFGLFFVGEYLSIVVISALVTTLYFGGWLPPFGIGIELPLFWFLLKTFLLMLFFVLLRASLPRPRYDQLMDFGWKVLLPLALLNLVVTAGVLLWTQGG